MKIEIARTGLDPELVELFRSFYHRILDPLNAETPLSQVLDDDTFDTWMNSPDALKLFVLKEGSVMALAVLSFDLSHDPLISQPFFAKHFPGRQICHIPAICIDEEFRKGQRKLAMELIEQLKEAVRPSKALCIMFHSRIANPAMPRLIRLGLGTEAVVSERDAMACVFMDWITMATD